MRDETFTFVKADSFTTLITKGAHVNCSRQLSTSHAKNLITLKSLNRTEVRENKGRFALASKSAYTRLWFPSVSHPQPCLFFMVYIYFSSHPFLLEICSAAPFYCENRPTLQPGCLSLMYSLACCCGCACLFLVSHRRPLVDGIKKYIQLSPRIVLKAPPSPASTHSIHRCSPSPSCCTVPLFYPLTCTNFF